MARTHYGRNAGSDTNGIFFNAAGGGTNYANQDAAQVSVTDGVTGVSTTLTSATANFTTAMVGNGVYIAGGSGSLTGDWFEIASRTNSTTVVLTSATGINGHALATSTGVTVKVGGACSTSVPMTPLLAPGDSVVWLASDFSASGALPVSVSNYGGGTDLTQFPFAFVGGASHATVANGGKLANSSGGHDWVAASDSGGSSQLAVEEVAYTAADGTCLAWIARDISHTIDTPVYGFAGNANITTSIRVKGAVWDSGYAAVYNYANGALGKDSTANGNDGTVTGATFSAGPLGSGATFNGSSDKIEVPAATALTFTARASLELFVQYSGFGGGEANMAIQRDNDGASWGIGFQTNGAHPKMSWVIGGNDKSVTGATTLSTSTDYHLASVYDDAGSAQHLYVDAAEDANSPGSGSGAIRGATPSALTIATLNGGGSRYFGGKQYFIRLSSVTRSPDWILAGKKTAKAPTSFYTWTGWSAGGAIAASLTGVASMSAALTGAGALASSQTGVASIAASLTGVGALASTMTGVASMTATLAGTGALVSTMTGVASMTATISQPGGLAVDLTGVASLSASLTGAGALASSQTGVASMTATVGGAGALAVSMTGVASIVATVTQPGAMSVTLLGVAALSASLKGSGRLQTSLLGAASFSATASQTGHLAATMLGIATFSAYLSGDGWIPIDKNDGTWVSIEASAADWVRIT